MELKPTYLGTMISLATAAMGLVAALAWNKFIQDLIAAIFKPGNGLLGEFIYAVLITLIGIFVIQLLGKVAQRDIGPKITKP